MSFGGYPPLHGNLILHTHDGELSFEIWIREPEFRVELSAAGEEPVPWVSDGTTSNIREPHVHAGAFLLTDPREIFRSCRPDQLRLIGRDEVLARSVTVVSCRSSSEEGSYWIDDEIGLVLKGERKENAQSASWELTALELNPEFPLGLFVVPTGSA